MDGTLPLAPGLSARTERPHYVYSRSVGMAGAFRVRLHGTVGFMWNSLAQRSIGVGFSCCCTRRCVVCIAYARERFSMGEAHMGHCLGLGRATHIHADSFFSVPRLPDFDARFFRSVPWFETRKCVVASGRDQPSSYQVFRFMVEHVAPAGEHRALWRHQHRQGDAMAIDVDDSCFFDVFSFDFHAQAAQSSCGTQVAQSVCATGSFFALPLPDGGEKVMSPTCKTRPETDSLGTVEVPADCYWGAQTWRAQQNFRIGLERMPEAIIRAFAIQKAACAKTNHALGLLPGDIADAIRKAAEEVLDGEHHTQFPLRVWQTGSGTQTNMNVNEVLAGRGNEILTGKIGGRSPVHPNDHCNMGQSSNDSFPTVMHIALAEQYAERLQPALRTLLHTLQLKRREFRNTIKVGRTHMMDATPLTLGQEFSGYVQQVRFARQGLRNAIPRILQLAQGGTAVGSGVNAHPAFGKRVVQEIARRTGLPFVQTTNHFEAQATHDAMVAFSGSLNSFACALMKIGNDIRLLGSGPRCGLGELLLPANEPGSSIMPGKVNPTQIEALTMVCAQVMGNHVTVSIAGASGHLQLNVFKPLIALNVLQSVRLLADACNSFCAHCLLGLKVNRAQLTRNLDRSLMLVTALSPHIGYDKAAHIAEYAHAKGCTLREAASELGLVTQREFDAWVRPEKMLKPSGRVGRV